jgi:hypothetical protein
MNTNRFLKPSLLLGALLCLGGINAHAQCTDPWVTQAVKEVKVSIVVATDCPITNYGGGHWSSYADLKAKVLAYFVAHPNLVHGPCNDPFVTLSVMAFKGVINGSGASFDCSNGNYGGGQWSGFADLQNKVVVHFRPQSAGPGRPVDIPQNPMLATRSDPNTCLGVQDGTVNRQVHAVAGYLLIGWPCDPTLQDQKFSIPSAGQIILFNGLTNLIGQDSLCMDDKGGALHEGDPIVAWPCRQSSSAWTMTAVGQISQRGMCVELRGVINLGLRDAFLTRCDTSHAAQLFTKR